MLGKSRYSRQTLRKMNEIRPFKLMFLVEGPGSPPGGGTWEFAETLLKLKGALEDVTISILRLPAVPYRNPTTVIGTSPPFE